ncbi:hypothetical protein E2I00_005145, partial [Balaenoptera physalus]
GDHVWLNLTSADKTSVPIGGIIKETKPGKILVEDDEGKEHWIRAEDLGTLSPMHPNSAQGVDDMILLGDLNEAGMVHNLLIRYQQHKIYTYTGSILVAVNPYQVLPLYTVEQVQLYYKRHVGELPPHVFAIANNCYFNMRKNKTDQCCIISGESGAGKTETTKLILQFLATISSQHSWIEQQVLEANPILEGMQSPTGPASFPGPTIRNDNSSRFGKYIDIYFNPSGVIEGACIEQFLLEKSRVCRQGNCTSCEGLSDAKNYAHVRSAMKILMFSDSENWDLSKLLAAILHLGNVEFMAAVFENLDSSDVMETPAFPTVIKLLEVKDQALRDCLIKHSIIIHGEFVTRPLNIAQAADRRDAFVKGIYGHLFLWILKKINAAIFTPPAQDPKNVRRTIGLLDIFGFENFQKNSFEQLCINLANEHLQQLFVQHVFTMEQEEYRTECIAWDYIHYHNNLPTLDLLALKPLSIISLLDEESHFPQGTDTTLLQKLKNVHANNKAFLQPKNIHDARFGIAHFAGEVYYQAEGFLEKNRDVLSKDILALGPQHDHVQSQPRGVTKEPQGCAGIAQVWNQAEPGQTLCIHGASLDVTAEAGAQPGPGPSADSSKRPSTLAGQFKQSLDKLMKILTNCQPYFIRCIKPNDYKKPLLQGKFRQMTLRIVEMWLGTDKDWKVGKTKIFLKENQETLLAVQRSQALDKAAVSIQRALRGCRYRKEFLRQRQAAVTLQAWWRGYYSQRNFKLVLLGFERLQAIARSHLLAKQYQATRQRMIQLQALCRGYLVRQQVQAKRRAVVVIQAYARGLAVRRQKANGPLVVPAEKQKSPSAVPRRKRKSIYDTVTDTEMVEQDLEERTQKLPEVDLDTAALAVWNVILRFMGDIPEPVLFARNTLRGGSVMRQIHDALGRESSAQPPTHSGSAQLNIGEEAFDPDDPISDRPMSNLEKVQFIVGYAILRPSLRDEIYCQICKQLSENYKTSSLARGWILLGLCLGCFPPSERFMKYLLNFIGQGPVGYGPFCVERLRRTCANGVRTEPPSWLELQAVKSKKHVPIHVTLATRESLTVSVDSASTSREGRWGGLTRSSRSPLPPRFWPQFWSLGSGRDHVMDAMAQCEQLARERGESERQAPWRLYFRKEFFTPWHDSREDPVSTQLIYHQVLHGVWSGEYSFEKEEELVQLLAQHCYVQLGTSVGSQAVRELLPSCVPAKLYRTKTPEKWASLVTAAHAEAPYTQKRATPLAVQEQVVDTACLKWPLLFSRLFEVTTLSGPRLPRAQLILAVNWKGLYFLDQKEKMLLELSFLEVMSLTTDREAQGGQRLALFTLHEEEFEFRSPSSVAIAELVAMFLEGLKERSVFAMALQDRKATEDATLLPFKKGDLLILTEKQGLLTSENWTLAQNDRTKKTGLVPTACLYTIPTVTKPSAQLLPCCPWPGPGAACGPTQPSRCGSPCSGAYMGDYPSRKAWTSLELTDQIFSAALQQAALQDEVYCQILKQLTHNTKRHSEERGWQLLWLCTGLFPPGKALLPHAQKFTDTRRRELLAPDCSRRIQRVLRTGPRKQPPHQVEVEAMLEVGTNTRVREACDSIAARLQLASWEGCSLFIKIADKVISQKEGDFFFDSLRQVADWVYFMRKLWLSVAPGRDVKADTILHYHQVPGPPLLVGVGTTLAPAHTCPETGGGCSLKSSLCFTQELPKYLRGFHKCSQEDAVHLAGLIYKAQFGNDRSQLASMPKVLRELVPENLTRLMSSEEWKKALTGPCFPQRILLACDKHRDMTVEEAKVAFLKWICRWPTFGSAFFEVKQTSEPSYPDIIVIAINRHGVLLIHPKTKDLLTTYPFTKIASWSSGSTYFHMVLGSLGRGSRLLCETSLVSPRPGGLLPAHTQRTQRLRTLACPAQCHKPQKPWGRVEKPSFVVQVRVPTPGSHAVLPGGQERAAHQSPPPPGPRLHRGVS